MRLLLFSSVRFSCICLLCFTLPCKGVLLSANWALEALVSPATTRCSQAPEVLHLTAC